MAVYKHGAYGLVQADGYLAAEQADSAAFVYVGTAPVHTVEGGAANVNKPVLVNNIAEAKKAFGYSDDWASYTLCEAMHVHFELNGVGPLVLINVLDPATHKASEGGETELTPANGRVSIAAAESIILDSLVVKSGATTKVKGTDYGVSYDRAHAIITIYELTSGALGSTALTITYDIIDPSEVDEDDVIGATDGAGTNTGLYAVKNVYQLTGKIPAFILCPGFSGIPAVHAAMYANSQKINGHWDAIMFADIPLLNSGAAMTLDTAKTWKTANGYTHKNEKVFFPMVTGTDGRTYHISVLAAANLHILKLEQDGIPYRSCSNTDAMIVEDLYFGAAVTGKVLDDEIINDKLNRYGITSAAFVGGRWAIWGSHTADYGEAAAESRIVNDTGIMMLYYISNDFQIRRNIDVDQPMTANGLETIRAEEQSRLDALTKIGALIYGEARVNADFDTQSDILNGDFSFVFDVTTTPLAKSLTAIVNWTDAGFATYFADFE